MYLKRTVYIYGEGGWRKAKREGKLGVTKNASHCINIALIIHIAENATVAQRSGKIVMLMSQYIVFCHQSISMNLVILIHIYRFL